MPSARTTVGTGLAAAIIIGSLAGGVSTSVINRAQNGSTIVQGDTVFITENRQVNSLSNENPSIFVNSGAVMTYATSGDIPGGGVRLTASGSRNLTANWLVPAKYASGAILERADVECNKQPLSTTGSLVVNQHVLKASIGHGTKIKNGIQIGTGSWVNAMSGATANPKLTAGTYVSFITNSSGGAAIFGGGNSPNDCVIKLKVHEKYGR